MKELPDRRIWWRGAVVYQVYVRSFRDASGDGIGDLIGLGEKLEYLDWLGVDGIWLSPTMPSPDLDWGYDVSDYYGVHPELGCMQDLKDLIDAANDRGIHVLLDLVPNHTSASHTWFVEASGGRDARFRDYYVWADPGDNGGPPNNWRNMVGDSAWTFDSSSGQYYLHNFHPGQPDLNWANAEVHAAFEKVLQFWFDCGVAGFRIDVAHGLYKDRLLRDNPPLSPGEVGGHGGLRAVYNFNRPETHEIYRRWRKIAEKQAPPRVFLGETWVHSPAELARFYGDNDELQLAFNFPFLFSDFDATALATVVRETLEALPGDGCPVWTVSNHDVSRFVTRWCSGHRGKVRLALTLLLTLPGTVVLYYGDEIGMSDVVVPDASQRDAMTRSRPGIFNRDQCRTPLPWADDSGRGFSDSHIEPWMPHGADECLSVEAQRLDESSTLTWTRFLIQLRRGSIGATMDYEELGVWPGQWAYRVGDVVVVLNFSDSLSAVHLEVGEPIASSCGELDGVPAADIQLAPFEARLFKASEWSLVGADRDALRGAE